MSRAPLAQAAVLGAALLAFAGAEPAQAQDAPEEPVSARSRQVLDCEEAARLSIERDRMIDRSIAGAQEPDPFGGGGGSSGTVGSFPREMSKFEEEQRRRRLIDDCLAHAGTAAPEE